MTKILITISLLFLFLYGCGVPSPTMSSGDSLTFEHGTMGVTDAMKGAQEYCESRNKQAKLLRTDCPWRCVSNFECIAK